MSVQHDFGGFDPAFIGITLRFSNARAFDFHRAHFNSPQPAPIDHLDDAARYEALSLASVVAHEVRHFHDFFLTPHSALIFSRRMRMAAYLIQCLPGLLAKEGNCIPLPLTAWCAMDAQARRAELAWLGPRDDGMPWRPIDLPIVSAGAPGAPGEPGTPGDDGNEGDTQVALLQAMASTHDQIQALVFDPAGERDGQSFQSWQVSELSALCVQMADMWRTYGQEPTRFFFNRFEQSPVHPYAAVMRLTRELWTQRGEMMRLDVASAMAFWSATGSGGAGGSGLLLQHARANRRFARLWFHLRDRGLPADANDPMRLFESWSRELDLPGVPEGLDEAVRIFAQTSAEATHLAQVFAADDLLREHSALLARVAQRVLAGARHMQAAFLHDPIAYVSPERYVDAGERYLNPLQRNAVDGGTITGVDAAALEARGGAVQWAREVDGRMGVESYVEPCKLSAFDVLGTDDALGLASLLGLADCLVAKTDRQRADTKRAGQVFFESARFCPVQLMV